MVKSSYRLISLTSSVIVGGVTFSLEGSTGDEGDRRESLLQSRRSDRTEGDRMEVDEVGNELIPWAN